MGKDEGKVLFDCSNEIEKFQCKGCPSFQINSLTSLLIHIQDGHRQKYFDEDIYKCLKCSFVTSSKYFIVRHGFFSKCAKRNEDKTEKRFVRYRNGQSELNFALKKKPVARNQDRSRKSKNKRATSQSKTWVYCKQCPYKTRRQDLLDSHMASCRSRPKDIRWSRCEHCPAIFKKKRCLKLHIQLSHSYPQDIADWFACDQCSAKFKLEFNLKTHVTTQHSNIGKKYLCQECPSIFKQERFLESHVKLCHNRPEATEWFLCPQCITIYKRKGSLAIHMRVRHPESLNI